MLFSTTTEARTYAGPRSLPWWLLDPHEKQALRNHDQTLERLAERGGLGPCEAVAILEDRMWTRMTNEAAGARLREILAAAIPPTPEDGDA